MNNIGQMLGWISFALLGVWRVYWYISEKHAESAKPRKKQNVGLFDRRTMGKVITLLAFGIVGVQLLGISLFAFPTKSLVAQVSGFFLVLIGLGVTIIGRYNLGTNWANCYQYQVKQKQELVTHGIYQYIRHPLYVGIAMFFIGSELVVQSYLFYVYLLSFCAAYFQSRWEEEILLAHFGNIYKQYMKRTKRFIPYIW